MLALASRPMINYSWLETEAKYIVCAGPVRSTELPAVTFDQLVEHAKVDEDLLDKPQATGIYKYTVYPIVIGFFTCCSGTLAMAYQTRGLEA